MSSKLYVGNLSYQTRQEDLADAFAQYGEIADVKIIQDRMTGRSRGFGFVTFATSESAKEALKMDGQDLGGRNITVSFAQEKPEGERRSGGFGGGGRGGFGGERRGGGRGDRNGGGRSWN